jgi:hypothetical protein
VGKPKERRPLEIPRNRREDNIKMNLREVGCDGVDWIDVAQDRNQWRTLVDTVMNFRVPSNVEEFLSSCTTAALSRRAQPHGVS